VTTWGPLMRTRHTAAILTELGVTETIAADADAYVSIAVRLGRDGGWHRSLQAALAVALPELWDDKRSVRALEAWLLA
jgi:protein O-GlcNAc transferase